MQQVEMTGQTSPPAAGGAQAVRSFLRHWLTGRRGMIIIGIAIALAGLAAGWNWLTAIGAAPVILSLAPCAAMCALGACAMMKGNSSCAMPSQASSKQVESAPAPAQSTTAQENEPCL